MTGFRYVLLAGSAVLALSGPRSSCAAAEPAPQARISQGRLAGVRVGDVDAFLGIPYAAVPAGADRWRALRPAPHWHGVRSADKFGPRSEQPVTPNSFGP